MCSNLDDYADVLNAIRAAKLEGGLIGIDGIDGAGKTTLAKKISEDLGIPAIHIDDFLARPIINYVRSLRVDDLRREIQSRERPLIIEGICLRSVVAQIDLKIAFGIYIKRMTDDRAWADEDELNGKHKRLTTLGQEIFDYHARFDPPAVAQIVYEVYDY